MQHAKQNAAADSPVEDGTERRVRISGAARSLILVAAVVQAAHVLLYLLMHHAKKSGRNRAQAFEEEMFLYTPESVALEADMRRAEMDELRELGCEMAQGFLLSRPLLAADATSLLALENGKQLANTA